MGKYLSAEFYKVFRRRTYTLCMLALILGGEALLLFLLKTAGFSNATTYDDVLGVLPLSLTVGVYLVLAVCDLVFPTSISRNTLKNEVAYGMPRSRIYFGKLFAAVITAVVFCAVIMAFYLAVGALVFPNVDAARTVEQLVRLGKALAVALPVWLGALSFVIMLLFVMKGSATVAVVYVFTLSLGEILDLMRLFLPKLGDVCAFVQRCLINTPMDTVMNGSFDIPYAWAVGTAWFVASAVIGAICFQKREIS